MEGKLRDLSTKNRHRKTMTTTSKDKVEGYFILETVRDNVMYNLFYTNIYEFSGNCEEILDEGVYKNVF